MVCGVPPVRICPDIGVEHIHARNFTAHRARYACRCARRPRPWFSGDRQEGGKHGAGDTQWRLRAVYVAANVPEMLLRSSSPDSRREYSARPVGERRLRRWCLVTAVTRNYFARFRLQPDVQARRDIGPLASDDGDSERYIPPAPDLHRAVGSTGHSHTISRDSKFARAEGGVRKIHHCHVGLRDRRLDSHKARGAAGLPVFCWDRRPSGCSQRPCPRRPKS